MTRLQELLDLNAQEVARLEAERAAKKAADEAEARDKALAANIALRAKGYELLGALFTELAPAEAVASEAPIPLRLGPGPDCLYFGMRWRQGTGNVPVLIVDHHDRSGDYVLWFPAPETRVAETVAMAVNARAYKRSVDWENLQSNYYEDDGERRACVARFQENWPDLAGQAQAWLDEALANRAARLAQQQAQTADEAKIDDALGQPAPKPVATDAERALALLRELVDLVHPQPEQE